VEKYDGDGQAADTIWLMRLECWTEEEENRDADPGRARCT